MAAQIIQPLEFKPCARCSRNLPLNCFRLRKKRGKIVRYSQCGQCETVYRKQFYTAQDKTVLATRMRAYRKQNPTKFQELNQRYYQKHRQQRLERQAGYYSQNRYERLRYGKIYREANASTIKVNQLLYYEQHCAEALAYADRRRARIMNANGDYSIEEWEAKCEYWGWRCYLCKTELNSQTVTVEHRIPLCRNGSNWLANLAPACIQCNKQKGRKTEAEYREYIILIAN